MTTVGIDLGTSAIRVGVNTGGGVTLLETSDGQRELTAAISYAGGATHVGHRALGFCVTDPAQSVRGVKRFLGKLVGTPIHDWLRAEVGFEILAQPGGSVLLQLGERQEKPAEVAGALIGAVLDMTEAAHGERPGRAVMTHSSSMSHDAQAGLAEATEACGLSSVQFVADAVAAAAGLVAPGPERAVMIVDVGAAQLCASVLEVSGEGEARLLASEGRSMGGEDLDTALIDRLVTGHSGLDPGSREMVRQVFETLKIELSGTTTAIGMLPPHIAHGLGLDPQVQIPRDVLQELCADLLLALDSCCEGARAAAGLDVAALSELYLIGGSSRLPFVRERVERTLGTRARLSRSPSPQCLGAARLAEVRPPSRHPTRLRDALSWAPGPMTGPTSAEAPEVPPMPAIPRAPRVPDLGGTAVSSPAGRPVVQRAPPEPSAARVTIAPSQIDSGEVFNPTTAGGLLQLPIARQLSASDLDPIALPLLLLVTGNKRRTGTLQLRMDDGGKAVIPILEGRPHLTDGEVRNIADLFVRPKGNYSFESGEPKVPRGRDEIRMVRLVVEGLRRSTRSMKEEELAAALGPRLDRAPFVTPAQQRSIAKLGLNALEERTIKFTFNGKNPGRGVADVGVGRHTALSLMTLLTLYDLVEWHEVEAEVEQTLAETLSARATELEQANYFQVLGVHWSAPPEEILEAYEKLRNEVSPGQPVHDAAPDACARILDRAEKAYANLRQEGPRAAYRRATFPDVNFDGIDDFLDKKARAVALHDGRAEEAERIKQRREELRRPKSRPKPKPKPKH